MNKITKNLELLVLAEKYNITKRHEGYEIEPKEHDSDLSAVINENGSISYYVNDLYDHSTNWAEIDMKVLLELKDFCELMIKEEE